VQLALTRLVFEHGGVVTSFAGDTLEAAWGVPEPVDNDAARALDAAVAMRRELVNLTAQSPDAQPLRLHIGVHTGVIAAGNLASHPDLLYGAVGMAVAIARRVCREAEPGEILLTEAAWKRSGKANATVTPRPLSGSSCEPTLPALFRLRS
jgi:adenylate cyclase